jgi:hypothetical protein
VTKADAYNVTLNEGPHRGKCLAWVALVDLPYLARLAQSDPKHFASRVLEEAVMVVASDLADRIAELQLTGDDRRTVKK